MRAGSQNEPEEDPERIRRLFEGLKAAETEFPIKVEGTHTLPYTARVMALGPNWMDLKLIRPLPHEMAAGAPFEALLAAEDQRYRALIIFQGRQGYLHYRFSLPPQLLPCDQRRHKRYPFRPREKAFVMAQDNGLPGHGLSGPLVDLSLGGFAFRADRVLRLADHMPLNPGLGFFDKGKPLPMIKIRDLPKCPLFEARGKVANAYERNGEIVVGVEFAELDAAELAALQEVLDFREKMQHASSVSAILATSPEGKAGRAGGASEAGGALRVHPAGSEQPDALRLLERRSIGLLLAMAPGPACEDTCQALMQAGYLRVETVESLPQALAILRSEAGGANRLLMAAMDVVQAGDLESLQALQRDLGNLQELPVALLQDGSTPIQGLDPAHPLIRPLPLPFQEGGAWLAALDDVAGITGV